MKQAFNLKQAEIHFLETRGESVLCFKGSKAPKECTTYPEAEKYFKQ